MKKQVIGVVGLGLIGGSIIQSLRRSRHEQIVIHGYIRDKSHRDEIRRHIPADTIYMVSDGISPKTDLLIVCLPPQAIISFLQHQAQSLTFPCTIMDTGSTKVMINDVGKTLPSHLTFIGTHPMAGKETSGWKSSSDDLFDGKPWIVCPEKHTDTSKIDEVSNIISTMHAHPIQMTAEKHDELVAWASHLPIITASLLMHSIASHPEWEEIARIAGNGLIDTTRLASEDPRMRTDILETNMQHIRTCVSSMIKEFSEFDSILRSKQWDDMMKYMEKTKDIRDKCIKKKHTI